MVDIAKVISETTPLMEDRLSGDPFQRDDIALSKQNDGHGRSTIKEVPSYQNGEATTEKPGLKLSKMSRRSKCVLVLCTTAMFLVGCAFSLLGPFYPLEAEKKGVSVIVTGFVFGVFDLMLFIFSPVFGKYLTTIGPKFCYIAGIGVGGVSAILFGTLDKCPDGVPFIVTSLACRCVEAIGFASFTTTSFAIISSEFPDDIGFTFGILEAGNGFGFTLGPAIGGLLYELGGYGLPFYSIGGLILLNGILMYVFLPAPKIARKNRKRGSMLGLLRSPMVIMPMLGIFAGVFGMTTIDANFAKHMESTFHYSGATIGLFFTVMSVVYSVTAFCWGYLTDKKDIVAPLIIFGNLFVGLSTLIIGPSQLLPFVTFELPWVWIGCIILGASYGCTLIPTMKCMVNGACELGYEKNMDTYALVSGLFNSVHCLGGFLGPVAGGALIQELDYPLAFTIVGLVNFAIACACLVFFSIRYTRRRNTSSASHQNISGMSTDEPDQVHDRDTEFTNSSHGYRTSRRSISISDTY